MKFLNFILLFFFCCFSFAANAQKECNIWYFGLGAGLDFNNNTVKILEDSITSTHEGPGIICDTTGKLLFYSTGDTVWNKKFKVMPNGMDLIGGQFVYSSTSAALIIKKPLSNRYYYLISSDQTAFNSSFQDKGVTVSIIDIEGDGGNGSVIAKKVKISDRSGEKVAAIKHSNKKDVWVAIKKNYNDTLYIHLITENGFSSKIIKSVTYRDSGSTGQIKFSPNGKYLALADGNLNRNKRAAYVYDFNNGNGELSNERKIKIPFAYGLEFSPNSKLLYLTFIDSTYGNFSWLNQYRVSKLSRVNYLDSNNFKVKIPKISRALQLAPNGKIYIAVNDTFLSVINNPNKVGSACNFQYKGQLIKRNSLFGLPIFMASYFHSPLFTYNQKCLSDQVTFNVADTSLIDSTRWNFGDGSGNNSALKQFEVNHKFNQYGDYIVSLITYSDGISDSFAQTISFINPNTNFNANDVCQNDSAFFENISSISNNPSQFVWKFGDGEGSSMFSPKHFYRIGKLTRTFNVTLVRQSMNGCKDSITKPITINSIPSKGFTYNTKGNIVSFVANEKNAKLYRWTFADDSTVVASIPDYTFDYKNLSETKRTACLIVTNIADCISDTCVKIILANNSHSLNYKKDIKIYPNPNKGVFTIENLILDDKDALIEIYNSIGKLIWSDKYSANLIQINLNVSKGLYFLKVKEKESVFLKQIIIW